VSDGLPLQRLGRSLRLSDERPGAIYAAPRPTRREQRQVAAPAVDLTASLRAEIARWTPDVFASWCDIVDREPDRQLLDPPAPWRGRLRLLYARDPNTGAYVLLVVDAAQAATCHAAAAATFGIHPAYYAPTREV
jgi:hypothetical protein